MKSKIVVLGVAVLLSASTATAVVRYIAFFEVSPFGDGEYWLVTRPLDYDVMDTGIIVRVPRGFVTDFASIPRPFWSILPTWGKYGLPAVTHDFLYWDQSCTREQADQIMMLAMQETDVGWFRSLLIYQALRLGGSFAWRGNRSIRDNGLTRQIPEGHLPSDPRTTWSELQITLRDSGVTPAPPKTPPPDYCVKAQEVLDGRRIIAR